MRRIITIKLFFVMLLFTACSNGKKSNDPSVQDTVKKQETATMGGLKKGGPPLLGISDLSFTDSLPQALLLTAIVINFATTALLLVLSYRAYRVLKTDDTDLLRGNEYE